MKKKSVEITQKCIVYIAFVFVVEMCCLYKCKNSINGAGPEIYTKILINVIGYA